MIQQIRIGPLVYQVVEVERFAEPDDNGRYTRYYGQIDYGEQVIRLEANMSPERKWLTLWHEIVHALMEQAGLNQHDEQVVTILGYGIPAVLQDNPWLGEEPARDPQP